MTLSVLRSRSLLAMAAFLAVAGPSVAWAQADGPQAVSLDRPTRITRPGSYRLYRSLALRGPGAVITISASDVSLDLNGYTLSGPGDKSGLGVSIEGGSGIRVHNGTIARLGIGVLVANAHNVQVENLQIRGEDAGGPPPGEVGVMIVNSRGVRVSRNVITSTFLGIFVRGAGSGGNRIADNTITGGQNGQIGVCYNPDGLGSPVGPAGDVVYNNLVSRFNIGIQTSSASAGSIFRENSIAYLQEAIQEVTAGSNLFEDNVAIAIAP